MGQRALTADVYYPKKKIKGNYPGVILIHGGGWRSGDKSQTYAMAIAYDVIKQLNSFYVYNEVHTLADTPHPFWFFNL